MTYLPDIPLADYTYNLDSERIASFPLQNRDASKLLFYNRGEIEHLEFKMLPEILESDTYLVFNDTKVIPARMSFETDSGHKIEIFLLKQISPDGNDWECLVGNRRKFSENSTATASTVTSEGLVRLKALWLDREKNWIRFVSQSASSTTALIELIGQVPLPPYIKREPNAEDRLRYQTIFAGKPGAVAAPTASLHFTEETFVKLKKKGISFGFTTLHVSAGTFKPVTSAIASQHEMHGENFVVNLEWLQELRQNLYKKVIPVGTTSMRVLESIYYIGEKFARKENHPQIIESDIGFNPDYGKLSLEEAIDSCIDLANEFGGNIMGETSIFILPGFQLKLTAGLITNFHQPGSTLLLLVAALVGPDWERVYQEALGKGYRFLSYGDASLLLPTVSKNKLKLLG